MGQHESICFDYPLAVLFYLIINFLPRKGFRSYKKVDLFIYKSCRSILQESNLKQLKSKNRKLRKLISNKLYNKRDS